MSMSDSPLPSSSNGDSPPSSKARRLSHKQSCQALLPPQPPLPLVSEVWKDIQEEAFEALGHRRQYWCVYNKFWYWLRGDPEVEFPEGSVCTKELWALARAHYDNLNRYQKNMVVRHFMNSTYAPQFLLPFARQQWCVSTQEKDSPSFGIDSHTALLTYQGNWGLVPSATLDASLSDDELTKEVRKLPVVIEKCRSFGEHCQSLANKLTAASYACSVEICLSTWRKEQVLRLHGHFFAKSYVSRMRCERGPTLMFEGSIPHNTAFVMSKPTKGWAGAYYTTAPKNWLCVERWLVGAER